jgi:tryptophan 2,3-dioxygenase
MNEKQVRTKNMSDTSPSREESIEIEGLQHLARMIIRAESLNNDVEVLLRKTPRNFKKFNESLLDIHKKTSRLILLLKPSELIE